MMDSPIGLTGHRICSIDSGGFFLVGGWNPDFTAIDNVSQEGIFDANYVRQIWKYNSFAKKWQKLHCNDETAPVEMASHCLTYLNNNESKKLLMFGGSLSAMGLPMCSNRSYWYHVREQTWQEVQCAGDLPRRNLGHWFGQASFHSREENALYVASGDRLQNQMLINRLDLNNYTFANIGLTNQRRQMNIGNFSLVRQEIVVFEKQLYIFGGGQSFGESGPAGLTLGALPTFDLIAEKWHFTPCQGPADILDIWPFACTAVLHDNCVFLAGGLLVNQNRVMDSVLRLDLEQKTWTKFSKMPLCRWFHASVAAPNGHLFIYGGCTSSDYLENRDATVYEIDLEVQSLQMLAWRSLTNEKCDILQKMSNIELRSIGIPQYFIDLLRF